MGHRGENPQPVRPRPAGEGVNGQKLVAARTDRGIRTLSVTRGTDRGSNVLIRAGRGGRTW